MSRGPGHVQRAILALIQANPDGAWSLSYLCELIYPSAEYTSKAQLVAVGRAIRRMTLPGTWRLQFAGGWDHRRFYLYDPCNLACMKTLYPNADPQIFEPDGWAYKQVERAKRWRDASPVERIDNQIEDAQVALGIIQAFGAQTPKALAAAEALAAQKLQRIEQLEAEKAKSVEPAK